MRLSIFTKFLSVWSSSEAIWCLAMSALLPRLPLVGVVTLPVGVQGVALVAVVRLEGFLTSHLALGPEREGENRIVIINDTHVRVILIMYITCTMYMYVY